MAKSRTAAAVAEKQEDLRTDTKVLLDEGGTGFESKEPEVIVDAGVGVQAPPGKVEQTTELEAAVEFKKQIEALKRSEETERQRADTERQRADQATREREVAKVEAGKFRTESFQHQFDSVNSALAASKSEIERAKVDIKTAITSGDVDLQTDAYARLAEASANFTSLNSGLEEMKARAKEPKVEQVVQQRVAADPLDNTNLPDTAKTWLRKNPAYLSDPRKNSKIQALHWDVLDEGHKAFSDEYFESLEQHLGMRQRPVVDNEDEDGSPPAQQRTSIVSAPVSREVPSSSPTRLKSGQIRLTGEQREAAKISGVTEAEYAKQLEKIREMKANGSYGDGR